MKTAPPPSLAREATAAGRIGGAQTVEPRWPVLAHHRLGLVGVR
ncbi:hypothetical protein [Nitrobacter sp.]